MIPFDLKDFEKFLKVCRKYGLDEVNFPQSISVKFGAMPAIRERRKSEEQGEIPGDGLSEEQLMFYHLQEPQA